jgi:hypothetical protein
MRRQVRVLTALAAAVVALGTVAQADPAAPVVPPAPAEPPPPAASDHADGKGWSVRAKVVVAQQRSQPARLEVRVTTLGAFHLNDDYPTNFVPAAADGIRFTKTRFDRKDAVFSACDKDPDHRCGMLLAAPFVARGAGRAAGVVAFSACDDDQCLIEKVALSVPFPEGK